MEVVELEEVVLVELELELVKFVVYAGGVGATKKR